MSGTINLSGNHLARAAVLASKRRGLSPRAAGFAQELATPQAFLSGAL